MLLQKYGLKFSYIILGIFTGLPFWFTKTNCTRASAINSLFLVIICIIENDVLVIFLTKDLILNSSSNFADFLYWILQDLTTFGLLTDLLTYLLTYFLTDTCDS